jgi:hypothetical protein
MTIFGKQAGKQQKVATNERHDLVSLEDIFGGMSDCP